MFSRWRMTNSENSLSDSQARAPSTGATESDTNARALDETTARIPIYAPHLSTYLAATTAAAGFARGLSGTGQASGSADVGVAEGPPGQRLWQSLVLPLVLACIIFLVALWTRQISLALTNDALMVVMVLAGVFVIVSGVAFWLSCDSYFPGSQQRADEETGHQYQSLDGRQQASSAAHQTHHHRLCAHARAHLTGALNVDRSAHAESQGAQVPAAGLLLCQQGEKCCGPISIIDCQPPDYYSALLNSMPIRHYLECRTDDEELTDAEARLQGGHPMEGVEKPADVGEPGSSGKRDMRASFAGEPIHEDENSKQLFLFPPSYDQLAPRDKQ